MREGDRVGYDGHHFGRLPAGSRMPEGERSLMSRTIRIVAPHFCAGLDLDGSRATNAAPIISYMRGWTADKIASYCERKGWQWSYIAPPNEGSLK